jgi:hypothetical protein
MNTAAFEQLKAEYAATGKAAPELAEVLAARLLNED